MSKKYEDYVETAITLAAALYLGLNGKGKRLKNVAKESIHHVLDENQTTQFRKNKKKYRDRSSRRKEKPTLPPVS
jgi:hypothetical protein